MFVRISFTETRGSPGLSKNPIWDSVMNFNALKHLMVICVSDLDLVEYPLTVEGNASISILKTYEWRIEWQVSVVKVAKKEALVNEADQMSG